MIWIDALLLLAWMIGTSIATGGLWLAVRPLWLDEFHTLFLTIDGSVMRMLGDLSRGADFNPPLLFLMTRTVTTLTGGVDPLRLRLTGFLSVWLALVVVYLLVRRYSSRAVAFASAALLWTHPLVVTHAYEARFYGPMLLFAAFFVLAVVRRIEGVDARGAVDPASVATAESGRERRDTLLLALSAVLLCTIHYFGVIVWVIVLGAALITRGRSTLRPLAPALAGPIVLLAFAPYYFGQRAAVSARTWVAPVAGRELVLRVALFYATIPMLAVYLVQLVRWIRRRRDNTPRAAVPLAARSMMALALFPLVLVILSAVLQPTFVARYAIAALLWFPAYAALAFNAFGTFGAFGRCVRIGAFVLAAACSFSTLSRKVNVERTIDARNTVRADALRAATQPGDLVVVRMRHILYPLAFSGAVDDRRLRFAVFSDSSIRRSFVGRSNARVLADAELVERDVALVHKARIGFPDTIGEASLRTLPRFVLVEQTDRVQTTAARFPEYGVREIGPEIFLLERR